MILRDYQENILTQIDEELNSGNKKILVQMPTGTGKTIVFCEFIRRHSRLGRILILVHRKELLQQTVQKLSHFGVRASSIASGNSTIDLNIQVQVAMVQTLSRRLWIQMAPAVLIVDEAHHYQAGMYQTVKEKYATDHTVILGYTATPIRLDGKPFSDHFDVMVKSLEIKEFIKQGYLSDFSHFATAKPDIKTIKVDPKTHDYKQDLLAEVMIQDRIMADIVDGYIEHGKNGKAIVFCVNKLHCVSVCQRFRDPGYKSDIINSDTPANKREAILEKFRGGAIQILCNVDIFTEGFDCPDIECVILARPTKSLTLYLQQIGRALRVVPNYPERKAIILDNAMNWERFGLVSQQRDWSLNSSPLVIPQNVLIQGENTEITETEIPLESKEMTLAEIVENAGIAINYLIDENEGTIRIPGEAIEQKLRWGNAQLSDVRFPTLLEKNWSVCDINTAHFKLKIGASKDYAQAIGIKESNVQLRMKYNSTNRNTSGETQLAVQLSNLKRKTCVVNIFIDGLLKTLYRQIRYSSLPTSIGRDLDFEIGGLSSNHFEKPSINFTGAKSVDGNFNDWYSKFKKSKVGQELRNEIMALQIVFDKVHNG